MNTGRLGLRRRRAAIVLAIAWLAWWHHWSPVFLVGAAVVWLIIQRRVDNGRAEGLRRVWRLAWPPEPAILLGLMSLGVMTFVLDTGPIAPKVMPIALHALALSILVLGAWWRAFLALPVALGGDGARR